MNDVLDHIGEEELDRFEARYFDRMTAGEAAAFDEGLRKDPAMNRSYRAFRLAVSGIRSVKGRLSPEQNAVLRERLRQVDEELDRKSKAPRTWLLAAAFVTIIVVAVAIWTGRRPKHEILARDLGLAEPGLPVLMSDGGQRMDEIMNAYKTERFVEAGELLRRYLATDPHNDTLQYFAGVVAERSHGCQVAIDHYDQVRSGSAFAEKAIFRKGICLLSEGQIEEARRTLQSLTEAKDAQIRQRTADLLDRL